jgi:hypothetical protein
MMAAKDIAVFAKFAHVRPDGLENVLRRAAKRKQCTAIGAELRERESGPTSGAIFLLTPTDTRETIFEPLDDKPVDLVRRRT